jgi:small subunit ribosomal protein S20
MLKKSTSSKKGEFILAIHPSAIKRAKQNEKGRVRNLNFESTVKSSVKKVREAIEEKDTEGARKALLKTIPLIQKGCSKGIFHKNTSARKISRLTQAVNGLKPAK